MRNIKTRLYLLVLITTLPFILYTTYTHYQNIQAQKKHELDRLTQIANITAAQHKQITEGARQLLIALASTARLNNSNATDCSMFLASLRSNYIRYENFGIVKRNGDIECAADQSLASNNPLSQSLIDNTLNTQSFTVGAYYQIKPSGAVINFAYPISDSKLVYASLSLDWVSNFVDELNKASTLVINILDRDGTVLARSPKTPDALGKNFVTDPLVQEILSRGSGQTIKVGIDQVERLYAFTALDESRSTFIAVGTPQAEIYTAVRQSLYLSIFTIIGITVISFVLAYKIGTILIITQIESLQAIDKLKDEFVSLASHQIRSPLTAIRWLSESLLDAKTHTKPDTQKLVVHKIYTTTLRLITLTSHLLNISRLEAGSLVPRPRVIRLDELLSPVIDELKTGRAHSQIKLNWLLTKKTPCTTDPLLVKEVLSVLIDNAIKYTHQNQPIIIQVERKGERLLIHVKNNGIGIPKSARDHLFTRFYRGDNARLLHPDGNGLGLYHARLIAQKLGGTLTYTSFSQLTTFTLSLPNEIL